LRTFFVLLLEMGRIPALRWLLALAVLVLTLELMLLRAGLRQQKRTARITNAARQGDWQAVREAARTPSLSLVLAPLLGPTLIFLYSGWLLHYARTMVLAGKFGDWGLGLLYAFSIQGTVIPLGLFGTGLAALPGGCACYLLANARMRMRACQHAANLAATEPEAALAQPWWSHPVVPLRASFGLFLACFGPVVAAAFGAGLLRAAGMMEAFDQPADAKQAAIDHAFSAASTIQAVGFPVSCGAALLGLLTFGALSRRAAALPAPRLRICFRIAGALLLAAGALWRLAAPMRAENALPWPSGERDARVQIETPRLIGRDPVPYGALLELETQSVRLNARTLLLETLATQLDTDQHAFSTRDVARTELVLACTPNVSTARVVAALQQVARAGYRSVTLAFEQRVQQQRPWLGAISAYRVSGVHLTLVEGEKALAPNQRLVDPSAHAQFGQLAAQANRLRAAGGELVLPLPPGP
jgi:hypothetical protein